MTAHTVATVLLAALIVVVLAVVFGALGYTLSTCWTRKEWGE